MKEISDLLRKGTVKSHISKIFGFTEIQAAHLQIETEKTKGKNVISMS
jgi:NADPH:quinone reductase-like Zn-dependent oxidoreductase